MELPVSWGELTVLLNKLITKPKAKNMSIVANMSLWDILLTPLYS